ncbi:hypothetical protein CYMTET_33002, partial [Cymbomonas tetramitiformis]
GEVSAEGLVGFLHENVVHFIAEDAIEDLMVISAHLSDAITLLRSGGQGAGVGRQGRAALQDAMGTEAGSLPSSTGSWERDRTALAASLAARGTLFANQHPAPSQFRPLRASADGAARRAAASHQVEIRAAVQNTSSEEVQGSGGLAAAADLLPYLRHICAARGGARAHAQSLAAPFQWDGCSSGHSGHASTGGEGSNSRIEVEIDRGRGGDSRITRSSSVTRHEVADSDVDEISDVEEW